MRMLFIAIAIIIIFVALFFLPWVLMPAITLRFVSTDKNSYSAGEKVTIKYSDFGSGLYCTCTGPLLELYHLDADRWKKISFHGYSNTGDTQDCVNGTIRTRFIPICDLIVCNFQFVINESWDFKWDMKIPEKREDLCGNETYVHYEAVDAPNGTYKAKYGMAEAIFYIE